MSGAKLSNVRVFAEAEDDGEHGGDYLATTDVNGNFYFKSLAPGVYWLKAIRSGYLESYYGSHRPIGEGAPK